MDWVYAACHSIESLGIHRHGLLFISAILVIPTIVCGNMTLFYLQKITSGERGYRQIVSPLLINLSATLICAVIFAWTLSEYL